MRLWRLLAVVDCVRENVGWVRDVGFAGPECEAVDLALPGEAEETASGGEGGAVGGCGEGGGKSGCYGQGTSGPREEGFALCDFPVCCAIELQD